MQIRSIHNFESIKLKENQKHLLRNRSIYLLPNIFTTAALFCGFFSIVQAMNICFKAAATGIFTAIVLDGIDGRIARLTHTQSAFGEQYDSLSDMVSFGVAPALVIYEWTLKDIGNWGWLAAFVYCSGAALRLARFNTNVKIFDKRFFQGLPSPAAAALITCFVWLGIDNIPKIGWCWMPWIAFVLTIYAGLAMISNAPFYSGKTLDLKHNIFFIILSIAMLFVGIFYDPSIVLFSLFIVYGVSGYIFWLYQVFVSRRNII